MFPHTTGVSTPFSICIAASNYKTSSTEMAILIGASAVIFYLIWMIFVGSFASHELLIGALGALLATTGVWVVNFQYPARFSPTLSNVLTIWRLPWYMLSGTWEIAIVAAKDLVGIEHAKSLFRIAPFKAGKKDDRRANARRVLACGYTTTAPNFIVLGVNANDHTLLFHQIERSSVPKMTQELGARQ
jgi:multisubunit Na+/H+ antiporter MnhE subunit